MKLICRKGILPVQALCPGMSSTGETPAQQFN